MLFTGFSSSICFFVLYFVDYGGSIIGGNEMKLKDSDTFKFTPPKAYGIR